MDVICLVKSVGEPTMVFLEHGNGRELVFGLGHPDSVLTFVDADGATYHSVGNTDREGYIEFRCRDQVDQFFAEMAIPESLAVDAAREFFARADRPAQVNWEPDW